MGTKISRMYMPLAAAAMLALALVRLQRRDRRRGRSRRRNGAASENLDARGPITYVQGKDNSEVIRPLVEKWNAAHPDEKVDVQGTVGQG